MDNGKGFLGSLFDLRFKSFITVRLIPVLYVLTLVGLVIAYVVIAIAIFRGGGGVATVSPSGELETTGGGGNPALGVLWLLVLGPLLFLLYTLVYRVVFELIIVIFRIFENTRDQLELTRAASGGGAPPGSSAAPPPAG